MNALFAYIASAGESRLLGRLYSNLRRGRVASTFAYDGDYLAWEEAYNLEPGLPLTGGTQAVDGALPLSFQDAAPDRWGRNLIAKRIRSEWAAAGRAVGSIDERSYLLGVSDHTRQGALRFAEVQGGTFQHPATEVPKLISLPELMQAADQVARDGPGTLEAVKLLLDAGTGSLGGARPKASVSDSGKLSIAKFGHPADGWDVMAWEKTALDLAEAAGVSVPERKLVRVGGRSVLVEARFDRSPEGRIGYISAATLLEAADGDSRDYLEIAETLPEHSSRTVADLQQLWRRIAFSIAIHNTDDHLRNHGYLRNGAGWILAPAFDMNPNPQLGDGRITSVGGAGSAEEEVRALVNYADVFNMTEERARATLSEVANVASGWAAAARRNGIDEEQIAMFAPALNTCVAVVGAAGTN